VTNPDADEAADKMLSKVRSFVSTLDDQERALFAALLAPGIAAAWDDDEVEGFGIEWSSSRVQEHLREAVRRHRIRIDGL
jgi:hypothetical protein